MIPGDLLSAFTHRQFHTLPSLFDSWVALPNSNPNACVHIQGGSLYHLYDGLWYDPAVDFNHDDLISEKAVLPTHRWGCRKAHNLLIVALLTSNVHKSKLYIYKPYENNIYF